MSQNSWSLFHLDAKGVGLMEEARNALSNAVTLPPEERHIFVFSPTGGGQEYTVVGDGWVRDLFKAEEEYYSAFPEGEFCPQVRMPHLELDSSGGSASHVTSLTEVIADLRGFEVRFLSAPRGVGDPSASPVFVAGRAAYPESWIDAEALKRVIREYASDNYRLSAYRRWFQAVTSVLGLEDLGKIAEEVFSSFEERPR